MQCISVGTELERVIAKSRLKNKLSRSIPIVEVWLGKEGRCGSKYKFQKDAVHFVWIFHRDSELDVNARDVLELQDAPPEAQVDARNDEAEDADSDVTIEDSGKRVRP
ncbi:Uncharacterized protein Adt_11790 [Abeliophyllum distichum]|uniref:Uncharacterized protein n=1 Tax=Abeliophyllum distichum TaxID=126358 RepID=A0ABD1UNU6_9LAMI